MNQYIQIREYCSICDEGYLGDEGIECPYCDNGWVYKWINVADVDQIDNFDDYFEVVS